MKKAEIKQCFPDMCNRYKLIGTSPIGEPSGFGEVWKAKDNWLGREVAIKISNSDLSAEVLLCRDIEGQTVRIFEYYRGASHWNAYAMELLDEPWISFRKFIEKHKHKKNDIQHYFDCFEIAYHVLQGLKDIHGRPYARCGRYVHADIKPENIFLYCAPKKRRNSVFRMLGHDQLVKIIDLGVTVERGAEHIGYTPDYSYPDKVDARPGYDIYAVGLIFLEMISSELQKHEVMGQKKNITSAVSKFTSGASYIDEAAVTFIQLCARAATQSQANATRAIDLLDELLFNIDPITLIALRAITKKLDTGINKEELASFLFDYLKGYYGWTRKTVGHIEVLKTLIKDMYERGMLRLEGRRYFVR